MGRPKACRRVCCEPGYRFFKPQGTPLDSLGRRDLGLDELESIRLADVLGLSQAEAAQRMSISQPTFNRILASARRKTAECIVDGLAIRIESPEMSNSILDTRDVFSSRRGPGHRERRNGR